MPTTIQIKETTKQRLDTLKSQKRADSYDEVIQSLLGQSGRSRDMFGFAKGKLKPFAKEDEMDFDKL